MAELTSDQFMQLLDEADNGMLKNASSGLTGLVRRKLREDAFSPAIIPHDEVTNSMLTKRGDTEAPSILMEMEPDQFGASMIPMNDTANSHTFFGNKFWLYFYTNSTPVWYKNVDLLRTYEHDIRQMITDNSLRDLARNKDMRFMEQVNAIVGVVDGGLSPKTLKQQNVVYPGTFSRENVANSLQLLKSMQLLNGVFLLNSTTFSQVLKWNRNEMGGDMAQELALKGTAAFEKARIMGVDFIVTMKTDLVPNGVMYEFTTPNYLGKAAILQAPTMYVRKDHDMLSFDCREKLGVAIANPNGVFKVKFLDLANSTGGDGRLTPAQIALS